MGDLDSIFGGAFDAEKEAKNGEHELIPKGVYDVEVEVCTLKTTQSGTGKFVHFQLDIVSESETGRKLFVNCNLVNDNATAVEIGRAELGKICMACGCPTVTSTSELLGKFMQVKVDHKKDKRDGSLRENIVEYKSVGVTKKRATVKKAAAPKAAPAADAKSESELPWKRELKKTAKAPNVAEELAVNDEDMPF